MTNAPAASAPPDDVPGAVRAEKAGAVGRLIFDNPKRHNAVSLAMWAQAAAILDEFAADPAVRIVVVRGAGEKAFVSGADISKFESERASEDEVTRYNAATDRVYRALHGFAKPTVAMIRGHCVGGGVALAVCCDIRVAGEGASFAIPAAKLGLGYGYAGVKRLVDVVGPAFAKEIFFTARRFDAKDALAMGLINRAVPDPEVENYVSDLAEAIAANAPLTVASIKAIVGEIAKDPDARDLDACAEWVRRCFASEDYKEGRRAFLEKRPPAFKGR